MARTRFIKSKKKPKNLGIDMISNLSTTVIGKIISYLPIDEAVRTCILSSKWRYCWNNLSNFVFNNAVFPQNPETLTILLTVYRVLILQNGPILDFTLDISALFSYGEVDQLIYFLSTKNVEKLTLHFWEEEYKLPKSLFSCLNLTHLDLFCCVFLPPTTFEGFSCLVCLKLDAVSIDSENFGRFIASCPFLEDLILDGCSSVCLEKLGVPNLKSLYFKGNADSIVLENLQLLANVSLQPTVELKTSGLIKFFENLPVLEDLEIDYSFFKSLVANVSIPEKLPTTLVRLKHLKFPDMSIATVDEVLFVLCLMKSSPNLQTFTIELSPRLDDIDVENVISEYSWDLDMKHLRQVAFHGVSGTHAELKFIKILLAKSPVLQKMVLEPMNMTPASIVKRLGKVLQYKCASLNADIILDSPYYSSHYFEMPTPS